MITQQDLHDATPRVLQRLRDLVQLPSMGTVGGQSVASLLFEELGLDIRGPINDVDIFVPLHMPREERGVFTSHIPYNHPKNPTARTSHSLTHDGSEGYSHVKFICARSNVFILRTYQDGLRNFTLVRHHGHLGNDHSLSVSQDIIDGFDLNAVQVGINIKHQKMVFSHNFLEFLNTKDLRVATCNTPTHTLIRLAKKAFGGELKNITCNFEHERSLITTYLQLVDTHRSLLNTALNAPLVEDVGKKYVNIATQFSQYLPPLMASPAHPELLRFNCSGEPESAHFKQLSELFSKANNKNFSAIFTSTLVSNFPKVFAVMENAARNPTPWNALQQAVAGEISVAHTIHTVHALFHDQILLHSNFNMPENQSVLFFHNQKCAKDPVKVQEIISRYNQFNALERVLLRQNQITADRFEEFLNNKSRLAEEFLKEGFIHCLIEVGEEASNPMEMDAFFNHAVQYQNTDMHTNEIHSHPFNNSFFDAFSGPHFRLYAHHFLRHYTPENKIKKLNALFDIMPLAQKIRSTASLIAVAHNNNVYDHTWLGENYWFMENGVVEFLRTGVLGGSLEQQQMLGHMLQHITDAQLVENNGALLRNILTVDHYETVKQRVMDMDPRWLVPGVLSDVCQKSDRWALLSKEHNNLITKLVLDLEVSPLIKGAKERRKM